jgi:hypothetical protein
VTRIELPGDIEAWAADAVAAGKAASVEQFVVNQLRHHLRTNGAKPARADEGDIEDQINDWIDHDVKGG